MAIESRHTQIDKKFFRFTCSSSKPLSPITVTEFYPHGKLVGSFTFKLAKNLAALVYEAAKNGDIGRKLWKYEDGSHWFSASKLSNENGFYIHVILADKSISRTKPHSGPIYFFIPSGQFFDGWFSFASSLDSIILFSKSIHSPPSTPIPTHASFPTQKFVQKHSSYPPRTYAQVLHSQIPSPSIPQSHPPSKLPYSTVPKHQQPPNFHNFSASSTFPCEHFKAPSSVFSKQSKYGRFLRIQSSGNSIGLWNDAFVGSSKHVVESWTLIGIALCQELLICSPLELYPINSYQAIFHVDKALSKANFEFNFTIGLSNYAVNRWKHDYWGFSSVLHQEDFHIEIFGVPFQFWSLDLFHAIGDICGEVLLIQPATIKLQDLSAIRMKIRNKSGLNSIPRVIKIFSGRRMFLAQIFVANNSRVDRKVIIRPEIPVIRDLQKLKLNSNAKRMKELPVLEAGKRQKISIDGSSTKCNSETYSSSFTESTSQLRRSGNHGYKRRKNRRPKKSRIIKKIWIQKSVVCVGSSMDVDVASVSSPDGAPSFHISVSDSVILSEAPESNSCNTCNPLHLSPTPSPINPVPNYNISSTLQTQIMPTPTMFTSQIARNSTQTPPHHDSTILSFTHFSLRSKQIPQTLNLHIPTWVISEVNRLFDMGVRLGIGFTNMPNHTKKFLVSKISTAGPILKPTPILPTKKCVTKDFAVQTVTSMDNCDPIDIHEKRELSAPLMGLEGSFLIEMEEIQSSSDSSMPPGFEVTHLELNDNSSSPIFPPGFEPRNQELLDDARGSSSYIEGSEAHQVIPTKLINECKRLGISVEIIHTTSSRSKRATANRVKYSSK